jgi:F-type H+/Na+-transporting ATPase subunit alpha
MKKVASTLKLDLSQYRELQAFAQFGSDLDKATLAKLNRGERTVEILKQNENEPLPVEKQVVSIFAVTKGYCDDIPVEDVRRFEEELLSFMEANKKEVLDHIREQQTLPEGDALENAVGEFKKGFKPSA